MTLNHYLSEQGYIMKKLLLGFALLTSTSSFASSTSELVLDSCNVKNYYIQFNMVTKASDKQVEETLIQKGYHFNQEESANGLDITIRKNYGQKNNQSEQGKESGTLDSIKKAIGGLVSGILPTSYTEERLVKSNGKTIFSLNKKLSTYSYGDFDSMTEDVVEALKSLPDCVEK